MAAKVPHATDRYVGSRIRMRRMLAGISQEKLGDSLGVTFQQVQKYEKGINRVSASRLQRIAGMLDVPVSFFFEGAPSHDEALSSIDQSTSESVSKFLATSEGIQLMKAFAQIKSGVARRRIIDLVQSIAEQDSLQE